MHITWHGNFCIKIQTGEKTLVIDPPAPATGLSPIKSTADIVALTNPKDPAMAYTKDIKGNYTLINTPGEYSIAGMSLHALGWHTEEGQERSIQRWTIEDVVILHVGALNRPLQDRELQELERTDIDVLFVPVGGGSSFTTAQAISFITTIEPRMVIPIHYAVSGLTESLEGLDQFVKEMGLEKAIPEKKVIVKKQKLPTDDLVTQILSL